MDALRETYPGHGNCSTVTLTVPQGSQMSLLRNLSRNMGWKMKVARPKPQKADPTCMTKEEYFAKIDRAKEQVRQGKVSPRFKSAEDAIAYLEAL